MYLYILFYSSMTILSSREHTCLQKAEKGVSKTQLCNNLLDPAKVSRMMNIIECYIDINNIGEFQTISLLT